MKQLAITLGLMLAIPLMVVGCLMLFGTIYAPGTSVEGILARDGAGMACFITGLLLYRYLRFAR